MGPRNRHRFRSLVLAGVALTALSGSAWAQEAKRHFDIAALDLAVALEAVGQQGDVEILFDRDQMRGLKAHSVVGDYAPKAALEQVLAGSGLALRQVNSATFMIDAAPAATTGKPDAPRPKPQAASQATPRESGDDAQETIVVTGTHIARPEVESTMPVSIISAEDAKNYGYNTVYDALRLDPAIGAGIGEMNSAGQEYDQGVANINLRNMGANRSLVLVDGERWVSSGARTSAVDLNTIPTALIDRYEVVTGGAAAIYGADAVTGAVNIIMKKEMTGLDMSATTGISGHGDAKQTDLSAATGGNFGDGLGHFVVGANYTYTAPVYDTSRFSDRVTYYPNPAYTGPNSGVPANLLNPNTRQINRSSVPAFCLPSGTACKQWYQLVNGIVTPVPQGSYTAVVPGEVGVQMGGPNYASNALEDLLLRSESQKDGLYAHASYEVTPTITWNGTLSYAHSYNMANPEWPAVRDDERPTNWFGGTTGEVATLNNPYLPASLRQFMQANNLTSIPLDRTYLNLPQAFEYDQRDNITLGSDVSGDLVGALKWQAFVRYGLVTDSITTTNMLGKNEWLNARNAITDPTTGQIECASATARASGCQPLNFFSTAPYSQALLNYIEFDRHEWNENTLLNTGGSINGSLFSLPAGDVSVAAGFAWRREALHTRDDPDTAKLADIVYSPGEDYSLHPALDASRQTTEAYGEAVVPVLKDLFLAKRLDIEGAYRFSHYSDEPNTNTWKGGGSWEPVSGFTMRGDYSRSVRVPNFGELYSPTSITTYGNIADPCQALYINQNVNYKANCAALLGGVQAPSPNLNAPKVYGGGNSTLTPETSNSYTVGGVFQPKFLGNVDFTVDYWNIGISNAITSLPYLTILNNCYNAAGGPNQTYCQLITRDAQGNVASVRAEYANLASQQARGIDFGANYRTPLGEGMLQAKFVGTYLLQQSIVAAKGQPSTDYSGEWDYPTFKATLLTEYSMNTDFIGLVTLGANTRFISRSLYDAAVSTQIYQYPYIPAYVDCDMTVTVRPTDAYSVTFGVNDISNAGVPLQLQANAITPHAAGGSFSPGGSVSDGPANYDAIGRYFFLKFGAHF